MEHDRIGQRWRVTIPRPHFDRLKRIANRRGYRGAAEVAPYVIAAGLKDYAELEADFDALPDCPRCRATHELTELQGPLLPIPPEAEYPFKFALDGDLADRVRAFAASQFDSIRMALRRLISAGLSASGANW